MRHVYRTERSIRLMLVAAVVSLGLGFLAHLDPHEWADLLLAISLVLTTEMFNSAVEAAVDLVQPGLHPLARLAKHAAAGGVLFAACYALFIGFSLFWFRLPRMISAFPAKITAQPGLTAGFGVLLGAVLIGALISPRRRGEE